jgi:hypothetical protein
VTVASGGWSLQFTLCSYTTRWDSTGAEQHAVKPRDKLICTDDSRIVLSDSYGSEVRVVCPVPEAELTTVNPTYNWKSFPPFLELHCANCGKHHVMHLHPPERYADP